MKLADLTGTSPMPLQSMVKKPSGMHPQAKHAFDLTNMEAPTYAPSRAEDTHFALQGRYPITDLVQVKEACAYFEDNYRAFHYEDRKEYAHNLCKRAAELGYDPWVPEKVKEYGGPVTATLEQVKEAFFLRQQFVRDDDRLEEVLNKVAEKLPYMTEVGRLQALQAFDKVASLERFYDVQLPDPYIALSQKWAAPAPFSEQLGAEIVREEELRFLASSGVKQLRDTFSDELVNRFLANPVSTYKGLPKEQRVLMGRLAKAWEGSGKGMDLQASLGDEKKKSLTEKEAAAADLRLAMKAGKITPEQRLMGLLSVRMSRRAQAGATATELDNIRQRFGDIAAKRHLKHQEFKGSTTAQIRSKINEVKGVLPEDAATGVRPRSDPRPVFNNSGDPDVIALRFRQETLPATTLHKGGTRMQAPLHSAKEPDVFSPNTRRTLRNTSLVAGGLGVAGVGAHALLGDSKKEQKTAASGVGDYAKTFGEAGVYGLAAGAGLVTGFTGTAVGINKFLSKLHDLKSAKASVNAGGHEKKAGLAKNTATSFGVGLSTGSLMTLSALGIAGALSLRQNPKEGKGQEKKAVDAMHDAREVSKFRAPHVGSAPKVNIGRTVAGVAGATIVGGALGLKGGLYAGDKIRSAYIKHKNKKKKEQEKEAGLGAEALTHVAMTITGGALGLHAGMRGGAVVMKKLLDASKRKDKD